MVTVTLMHFGIISNDMVLMMMASCPHYPSSPGLAVRHYYLVPAVKGFAFIKLSEFFSPCCHIEGADILLCAHSPGKTVKLAAVRDRLIRLPPSLTS